MARHIDHQGDMAIGASDDWEALLEPGQAFDRVRPRIEPMPAQHQCLAIILAQIELDLRKQRIEHFAVQHIELDEAPPRLPERPHPGYVLRAPGIGEGKGIQIGAPRSSQHRRGHSGDARAPVNDRAEDVEG